MAVQLLDYRCEIDETNIKAACYFPGISYDDFDRAGNISPWKISRMFESGRSILFRRFNYLDVSELKGDNAFTHFILGSHYTFDPCLWNMFSKDKNFPFKVTSELINLGQKSIAFKEVIINLLDNKQLASYTGKLVYIDRKTKRPKNYPSWHSLKYSHAPTDNDVNISVNVTYIPETAFTWKFVVMPSDIDNNGHTNQASYIRFFLDTAEMARCAKHLHHFTSDICLYPITTLSIMYKKEILCGQEVSASVWESEAKPSILNFALKKSGSNEGDDLAVVATASFRDNPSSKL
ncbi:unnamed protein product [Candidula unifasciata]|uniref:Acyl-ACP thioesterase-like C-terminal domain-containing protein n=1 Tax=Candidula unifasciata TaxID=100452 RepID=A0A8S3Z7I3_9EUPU|nr:unnamed protein product [Candidula unifasciata]